MLLKYNVSNFKSIADSIDFKMIPNSQIVNPIYYNTIQNANEELNVLKRAICYGANASGKTSFVESIEFAQEFILNGVKTKRRIPVNQFRGHDKDENISVFQFTFFLNGQIYEYGFSLDVDKVHEEWLILISGDDENIIYERFTDETDETRINVFSPKLFTDEEINIIDIFTKSIKPAQKNQLFLNKLNENGISLAEDIIEWFESISIISPESSLRGLAMKIDKDKEFAKFLSKLLDELDTGVKEVTAKGKRYPLRKMLETLDAPEDIINDIYDKKNGIVEIDGKMFIFDEGDSEPVLLEIKLVHDLKGDSVPFNKDDESDGTKRLLDILPVIFKLSESNNIFIIDELDRSFHTLITKEFLRKFIKNSVGTNSQLIVTMHDVNVIDLQEMSNQELWFFNKSDDGVTGIKPLSDYAIEDGYDAEFAYLAGRFGGIPNIKGV